MVGAQNSRRQADSQTPTLVDCEALFQMQPAAPHEAQSRLSPHTRPVCTSTLTPGDRTPLWSAQNTVKVSPALLGPNSNRVSALALAMTAEGARGAVTPGAARPANTFHGEGDGDCDGDSDRYGDGDCHTSNGVGFWVGYTAIQRSRPARGVSASTAKEGATGMPKEGGNGYENKRVVAIMTVMVMVMVVWW
jgi:hypothetical protein